MQCEAKAGLRPVASADWGVRQTPDPLGALLSPFVNEGSGWVMSMDPSSSDGSGMGMNKVLLFFLAHF